MPILTSSPFVYAPGFLAYLQRMWHGKPSDKLHAAVMLHAGWPGVSLQQAVTALSTSEGWRVEGDAVRLVADADDGWLDVLLGPMRRQEELARAATDPHQYRCPTISAQCPDCGEELDVGDHTDEYDTENQLFDLECVSCDKTFQGVFGLHSIEVEA